MNKKTEKTIQDFVKSRLANADSAHDYSHILRVVSLVKTLAGKKIPDPSFVIIAAYLHDISYRDEVLNHEDHVAKSKEISQNFLQQLSLNKNDITRILKIMDAGSSENYMNGSKAITYEEKILQDAGILDALGAVGIARLFSFSGHFREKFPQTIKYLETNILNRFSRLQTSKAKILGKQRLKFIKSFLSEYQEETSGTK